MYPNTKTARDPFTFSLYGIRTVNSHFMMPAIADDGLSKAWDARLDRSQGGAPASERVAATRQIEALLARYFAHSCCNAG